MFSGKFFSKVRGLGNFNMIIDMPGTWNCPRFLARNGAPPRQGLFQRGHLGSRYIFIICIYVYIRVYHLVS